MRPSFRVVLLLNMIDITTLNDQEKMKYLLIKQGYRFIEVCLQRKWPGFYNRGIMSRQNSPKD